MKEELTWSKQSPSQGLASQGIPRTATAEAVDPPSTRIRFDGGWFSTRSLSHSLSRSARSSSCILYPDADDDGPAEIGPFDIAEVGSDAAALPFRRGPPGAFGSLT